jgi:hypothetical protein
MAKRPLVSYSVNVVGKDVEVEIVTDRQKPYVYTIHQDVVHPDAHEIARHLNAGLAEAKATFSKVGITEDPVRFYVSIELPIKYHSDRYTAHKR